jgi:hypothetical protein
MEGYSNAGPLNGTAANAAPVGGRRHRSHKKSLKLVKKKTVRRMLKKMGLKMRGGDPTGATADGAKLEVAAPAAPVAGGRRHRSRKHGSRRTTRSLFGLRY